MLLHLTSWHTVVPYSFICGRFAQFVTLEKIMNNCFVALLFS